MDEILYLEPDEEITSVIDKLKKSESSSVGLVIPRNSTLVHSIVNLKLLRKKAQELDKELALITADKIGKNIAFQVGIKVFEDVHSKSPIHSTPSVDRPKGDEVIEVDMSSSADNKDSKKSGPNVKHYALPEDQASTGEEGVKNSQPDEEADDVSRAAKSLDGDIHSTVASHSAHVYKDERSGRQGGPKMPKALSVSLIFVLLLAVASVLTLPQSWVTITVAAEPFEQNIPVTVNTEAKEASTVEARASGKLLSVTNDDAQRVVATGKKDVGTKASGTVTIFNGWETTSRQMPVGTTMIASDGKAFALKEAVTVPGATVGLREGQLVTNPGSVSATIEAKEPGDSYNIAAGRFTISGLSAAQQEKIYAESSKPMSGGKTRQVSIMTQPDIDNAASSLAEDLKKAAIEQLKKEAKSDKLVSEALVSEVSSVETNPKEPGSETEYFDIKVKAKHQVIVFNEAEVQKIVDAALRDKVPAEKELILGEGDEFMVSVIGKDYANGKLELESKVKTKIGSRVDAVKAKEGLTGKSQAQAKEQLATITNVTSVTIDSFPTTWWQDISYMPWNTRVKVIYE